MRCLSTAGRTAVAGVVVGACLLTAGCATKYGGATATGGFRDSPINDRMVSVSFTGNGYVSAEKIQMYALYRCAELAGEARKPYFVLYESLTAAARDLPSQQPRVGTLGGKPAALAFVVLYDKTRPGAHETSAVLSALRPQIETDLAGTPPK